MKKVLKKRVHIRFVAVMMAVVMLFCEAKIAVSAREIYPVQADETAYDEIDEENL